MSHKGVLLKIIIIKIHVLTAGSIYIVRNELCPVIAHNNNNNNNNINSNNNNNYNNNNNNIIIIVTTTTSGL